MKTLSGYRPRASAMTVVCRPTSPIRFMPVSEHLSKQLMHYMARCVHAVVFLPMALWHATCQNQIQLATCIRTTCHLFERNESGYVEPTPPYNRNAYIPLSERQGAYGADANITTVRKNYGDDSPRLPRRGLLE